MEYGFSKSNTTPERLAAYAGLLGEVFRSKKFSPAYLQWLYAQNPHGAVVGSDAFDKGALVAHHATVPVSYVINGRSCRGLLALNNATLPAHQGKGLLNTLALKTFDAAAAAGYDFLITVTNKNSTPAYVRKFGFTCIAPLEVKIGAGTVVVKNEEDYFAHSFFDEESIGWRLANPAASYFKTKNFYFSTTHLPMVGAQLHARQLPAGPPAIIKKTNAAFTLWIGLALQKKTSGLFMNLPDKLKPSPLNLLFKDLSGRIPVIKKEELLFELLDFDAY